MRTDEELKSKIVELLNVDGDQAEQLKSALDRRDISALGLKTAEHHFTRGMVSALYWAMGYEFKDIIDNFVDKSVGTGSDF